MWFLRNIEWFSITASIETFRVERENICWVSNSTSFLQFDHLSSGRTSNWRPPPCPPSNRINVHDSILFYVFSVRSATVGEEKRPNRRRDGIDFRRMAVASIGEGGHLVGAVYQEQMWRRIDHSKIRHHCGSLSTRVYIYIYIHHK